MGRVRGKIWARTTFNPPRMNGICPILATNDRGPAPIVCLARGTFRRGSMGRARGNTWACTKGPHPAVNFLFFSTPAFGCWCATPLCPSPPHTHWANHTLSCTLPVRLASLLPYFHLPSATNFLISPKRPPPPSRKCQRKVPYPRQWREGGGFRPGIHQGSHLPTRHPKLGLGLLARPTCHVAPPSSQHGNVVPHLGNGLKTPPPHRLWGGPQGGRTSLLDPMRHNARQQQHTTRKPPIPILPHRELCFPHRPGNPKVSRGHFGTPRDSVNQSAEVGRYVLHLGITRTPYLTQPRAHRAVRVGLKKIGIEVPRRSATGGT